MFNIKENLQELRSSIIGVVLLLATIIMALVWIGVGVYICLTGFVGAAWAAILIGVMFMLPVIIVALIKLFNPKELSAQQQAGYHSHADDAVLHVSKVIESLSGQSTLMVTLVAVIAGFLAARFPSMLSVFTQIVSAYADDVKAREALKQANSCQSSVSQDSPP